MAGLIGRSWSTLRRLLLLLFGLAMFFGVMVFGAVVALGLTAWALLTGRRITPIGFGWKGPADWRRGPRRGAPPPSAADDVVDVEVREIEPPKPAPQRDSDPRQPR